MEANTTANATIQDAGTPMVDTATFQDYMLPVVQALIFVVTVYVDKFVRKSLWGKKYKQLTRITTMTVLTVILMFFNYEQKCRPHDISYQECFYLKYDVKQCLNVIVMNSILFGAHIQNLWTYRGFKGQKTFFRTAVFAPILQELLFRAVFYRSSSGKISLLFLSIIFSISHFHKYAWKVARGKTTNLKNTLTQLGFTFIFALYGYFVLDHFQSVIPCIVLHIYCNIIGPPSIHSVNQILKNLFCAFLFFAYITFYL